MIGPIPAGYMIVLESPIIDWEEYQITYNTDGTTTWVHVMYDPDSGVPIHSEVIPPVTDNRYF